MNSANLIGNLVRDPELRYAQSGTAVVNFTIAVQRRMTKDGEQQADFIKVIAFNKQAENIAKYLVKGSKAGVTGRIQTGSYDNKEGQKVYITEIIANEVEFLSSKPKEEVPEEATEAFPGAEVQDQSIPF